MVLDLKMFPKRGTCNPPGKWPPFFTFRLNRKLGTWAEPEWYKKFWSFRSKREKGNTWKELLFFRKFSTGMNRSIWILLGITVFSIQMVSAPRLSRLSPGQATCQPACHSLWRHATLLLAVWRQKNPVKILVYLIVRITHTMERILQPKLCIWLLCLFKKFTIFSSLILPVNKHRLYLEYWKSTHNRLGIKFRFS